MQPYGTYPGGRRRSNGFRHFSDISAARSGAVLHSRYARRSMARTTSSLCGAAPRATLVATGTGSGKTERFLYPILDHCAGAPGPGHQGDRHLPDERAGDRPSAALREGDLQPEDTPWKGARESDARLPVDQSPGSTALAVQRARHLALPGGGRAPHLRRRTGHGPRLPCPASPGSAPGRQPARLHRYVRHQLWLPELRRLVSTVASEPVLSHSEFANTYRPWETGQPLTYADYFRSP
jgi:hypothetical protein